MMTNRWKNKTPGSQKFKQKIHFSSDPQEDIPALKSRIAELEGALAESRRSLQVSQQQVAALKSQFEEKVTRRTAELRQLNHQLQQSNQELATFAYIASHDLQEPLRMITSYTQLLDIFYKGHTTPKIKEYMGFIQSGVKRMQLLIRDLLAFSHVRTEKMRFSKVDLNVLMDYVKADLKLILEEKNAQVTHDSLPAVVGDATQLRQLFLNLIENGIKFNRSKDQPKVHISAEKEHQEWIFTVRDNGIGIEPEFFDQIFIIFQRLHTKDEFPGTGIGLAICKKILENHGGRIWVQSKLEEGSIFYFSLPSNQDLPFRNSS